MKTLMLCLLLSMNAAALACDSALWADLDKATSKIAAEFERDSRYHDFSLSMERQCLKGDVRSIDIWIAVVEAASSATVRSSSPFQKPDSWAWFVNQDTLPGITHLMRQPSWTDFETQINSAYKKSDAQYLKFKLGGEDTSGRGLIMYIPELNESFFFLITQD